jgi:Bifunctional DNA primase/polymerase, N-terminal
VSAPDLARLGPGDLLAALGELPTGRAAEAYAALGFPVVPLYTPRPGGGCSCRVGRACPDPGKHPRLAGWQGLASTDPAEVQSWWRRWPAANVGLATGTRFDVLDVDGPGGEAELRALVQAGVVPRAGPLARTGGGGWHLWFAPTGLGNRGGFCPGLDWRGRGGLVVAPPSQHPLGRCYRWVRPPGAELPAVPAELRALLAGPGRPAPAPPPLAPGRGYGTAALRGEAGRVAAARPGGRRQALNTAALKLGRLVAVGQLEEARVWAELAAAARTTGLGEHEIAKTVRRALADARRHADAARTGTGGGRG